MLSDNVASWLVWVSLLMIILSILSIVLFYELDDYSFHNHDKGLDSFAIVMRVFTLLAFLFTLFYCLISLSVNHANSVSDSYVKTVEDKYGLSLSKNDIIDLSDGEYVKFDGKLLLGVDYKDDIVVLEYKNGKLEELPRQ